MVANVRWWILLACFLSANALGQYWVGAAQLDITPSPSEASDACMGGYGGPYSRCGVTSISDPLSVRSIALADASNIIVFTAFDAVGLGDEFMGAVRQRVATLSGGLFPQTVILLSATHTHSGPDLQGLWGGISTEYRERVVQQAAFAIVLSVLNLKAVNLWVSEGTAAVRNRRGWNQADNNTTLILASDQTSHWPVAAMVNMSAHPVMLPAELESYSADYVGPLRRTIEHQLGAGVLFVNGVVGDAEPFVSSGAATRIHESAYESMQAYGESSGVAILQALAQNRHMAQGPLQIRQQPFTHPITNLPLLALIYVGLIDVDLTGFNRINTQLTYFQVGQSISGVSAPGEVLTRLGLPLRNALPGRGRLFLGLTDGSYGYFLPHDEYGKVPGRDTEENVAIDNQAGEALGRALQGLMAR